MYVSINGFNSKKGCVMKFYNREKELVVLHETMMLSQEESQMTVLVGRRRIGKTSLLLKSTEGTPTLYFFVLRKAENLLCRDFIEEAEMKLNFPIGTYSSIGKLFQHLMLLSKEHPFNLIIDEFQELDRINPSVFGEMQKVWDLHKDDCRVNLLISGSVYSLMHKIFENNKEPLFSRAGKIIRLQPFKVSVIKQILSDYYPAYTPDDLLALYTFTGGVAWYVDMFMKNKAFTRAKMIRFMTEENSLFLTEGKNLLIEEFGKEYTIYFSILECIARGLTSRGELETALNGMEIGGYLSRLEKDFSVISQRRPIFARPSSRQVRYTIEDNFLFFWFRFVYKYQNLIEAGNLEYLRKIIERDFPTFSGLMLERYFRGKYIEAGQYTDIGGFWDRKGENEIDLIAVNEFDRTIDFAEIKRNPERIDWGLLKQKGERFLITCDKKLREYTVSYKGLSLEDM